jgi:hypothetical protein
MQFRDPAARCARVVEKSLARKRAQGMPGARCTRGLACKMHKGKRTRAYRYSRRHSGIPRAMALRLMPRSPRRRIRLVTVIGGLKVLSRPVGLAKTSADLTPATGARTTRFCRTPQHRSSARCNRSRETRPAISCSPNAAASTASHSNVRDDGQRPSPGTGRRDFYR